MSSYDKKSPQPGGGAAPGQSQTRGPGKQTLVEQIGAPPIQRRESPGDAKILESQASLKGTDVEIPALEGALLATRVAAVKLGLLSQASFDAGLALSQAMTRLSPAVAADGPIDVLLQETAAVAAHRVQHRAQARAKHGVRISRETRRTEERSMPRRCAKPK